MENDFMFCRKCGAKLPGDSVFCTKCGEKIIEFTDWCSAENSSKTEVCSSAGINYIHNNSADNQQVYSYQRYDSETKEASDTSKKTSKIITYTILLITAFLVGITVYFGVNDSPVVSSTPTPNIPAETPHTLPSTGSVFVGGDKIRGSELTIDCSNCSQSVYIKLKTSGGATAFAFFVRAGTTVTVKVPKGLYQVYFAQGKDWYGVDKLFGENTHYSKDDEFIDTSYKWSYTMYPVADGNFSQTPINSNDF